MKTNVPQPPQLSSSNSEKLKLSEKTWFHIFWMIVFFPAGLLLIWQTKRYPKFIRYGFPPLFVGFLIVLAGMQPEKPHRQSTPVLPTEESQLSPTQLAFGLYGRLPAEMKTNPSTPTYFITRCKSENPTVKSYTALQLREFEAGVFKAYELALTQAYK